MGINSKSKGKRGESEAAKLLEKWWGGKFCKTPDSGAFMTFHTKSILESGSDLSGDLICPEDFPFCVEVKRRKEIDMFKCVRLFNDEDGDHLAAWWSQAVRDAERSKQIPLLLFREDRKQWYCGLPVNFAKLLKEEEKNYLIYLDMAIISYADFSKPKEKILQLCETLHQITKTT